MKSIVHRSIYVGIALFAYLLIVLFAHKYVLKNARVSAFEMSQNALALESAIGFDGMIHSFKNAVLRADNLTYEIKAREAGKAALVLVEKLERTNEDLGFAERMPRTREMIETYLSRLDIVAAQQLENRSAEEIDALVRFDDHPASIEIRNFHTALQQRLHDRVVGYSRLFDVLIFVGCLALFVFYMTMAVQVIKDQKQAADALQRRNETLEKANMALQQFAGIAAHDLRAPVRHIGIFGKLIRENADDKDRVIEHSDHISRSADSLQELIESLLDFTRNSFEELQLKPVDMRSLVDEVVHQLDPEGNKIKGITIGHLPDTTADPALMKRVWANLISNAIKYSELDKPLKIRIRGRTEGKSVVYEIEDNGIGIDPKYAELIFKPLKRLHNSRSRFKGVGVGLALVRTILEAHGGSVVLDTGYSEGSRFKVTLPLG